MASEEQLKNSAYELWVEAGRPVGRDREFWHAAETELAAADKDPDAANQDPDLNRQPNPRTVPG